MRKRPDGYHEIASLFQAVDLFDRLFVSRAPTDKITCSDTNIPCDGNNLVVKAIDLFRARYPLPPVHIHIEKKIPIQAGLGGGSSNAATALWALNELIEVPADITELIEIATQIGSDVPFFFSSGTAFCTGRGEILEPFILPRGLEGHIAKPEMGLSTLLVYKNVRIEEFLPLDPRKCLANYPEFFNDLEIPSFKLEPRLLGVRDELKKKFSKVVMTGSGTAFFCLNGNPCFMDGVTFYPFKSVQRTAWY